MTVEVTPDPEDYSIKVNSPGPESPGKYVLVVYQPAPFGLGTTIFAVDFLNRSDAGEHQIPTYHGCLNGNIVVQFPGTFDYLLVSRDLVSFKTSAEIKALRDAAKAELDPDRSPDAALLPEPKGYL